MSSGDAGPPKSMLKGIARSAADPDGVRGGAAAIQPQCQGIQRRSEHQRVGEPGDWQ
jgi:hypothetical protein